MNQERISIISKGQSKYKLLLIALGLIVIIVMFFKWYWLIDVSPSIKTSHGIHQGIKAFKKINSYDLYVNSKFRNNSLLKGILFWPIEPTQKEIDYVGKFISRITLVYQSMQNKRLICDENIAVDLYDGKLKSEYEIANILIDYIDSEKPPHALSSDIELISKALVAKFPC